MQPKNLTCLLPTLLLLLLALGGNGCSREARLAKHLEAAERFFREREFEKAKIEYLNVLKMQRTNALAFRGLGKILFEQGQPIQAYPLLLAARDSFPDDLTLREHLLTVQARLPGETNRQVFLQQATEILQLDPTNSTTLLVLGDTARSPEDLRQFEEILQSLKTRVGRPTAIFHIGEGEIARKRGDTNACDALLRQAVALEPEAWIPHEVYGNFLAMIGRTNEAEQELRRARELTPPHSPAWERWARFLIEIGRTNEAKAVLDEINKDAPERIGALLARAQIAFAERDFDETEKRLKRALNQAPNHIDCLRALAQLRLAQNRSGEAIRHLEHVVELNPNAPGAHYQLAMAQMVHKDTDRAVASLEKALQLDPNSTQAAMVLAELQLARGNAPIAATLLQDVIRREPGREQAHLQLIRALRIAGQPQAAEAAARMTRQRFPQNASAAFQLGLVLREQDKVSEARRAFEEAMQFEANRLVALEQLVAMDIQAKEYPSASRRVQEQLATTPAEPALWLLKSEVHLAQQQFAECEAALRKVLELDPNSEPATLSLARLYARTGRQNEALAELDSLLKREPKHFQALLLSGMLQTERRNFAAAKISYQRALEVRSNSPVVLNNLAFIVAEHEGKLDEAHRLASQARERAPEDPLVADTLGWIEHRRGRNAQALSLLTEAAGKLTASPEVQFHLGMVHYALGNEAPAREALHRALQSEADFAGKATAREYLTLLESSSGAPGADAIPALEALRQQRPADVLVLSRLASAYEAKGDFAKAQKALEAGLAINPQSLPMVSAMARVQAQLDQPAKALEWARTARKLAPNDPEVAHQLGTLALRAGDTSWAYALLRESSRAFPDQPGVARDFALAAFSQGQLDEATTAMQSTLRMAGSDSQTAASARDFLALIEQARNPAQAANRRGQIDEALKKDPNNPAALFAAAAVAGYQGQTAEAIDLYERLLNRLPAFGPAIRELAVLYAGDGKNDARAFELGVKARQADPRDDILAAALGKVVCRRGDHRYAAQLLTEAQRSLASDPDLHFHLGLAQAGLKHPAEARAAFEKALALNPAPALAARIRQKLEELKENQPTGQ